MLSSLSLRPNHSPSDPHFSCPTCRDEGLPARVLQLDPATNIAVVAIEGGESEVALDLLDNIQVGDFVLVHIGTAIAKLNPADVIADVEVTP